MATGGYDQSLDNRVTCSICLEPYKGRQPKLLPCFHTFCLPCLTQLASRNDAQPLSSAGDGNGATAPVTLTCPTCRTPVPLPPAGVSGLHNNVYVDDSLGHDPRPLLCDLCEEGQSAKLNCSTCKAYFCTRCRRFHDKLCKTGQVMEIEVQQTMRDQTKQAAPLEVVDMLQAAMQRLLGEGQQSKQNATTPKETGAREKTTTSLESDVTDVKSLAAAFSQLMQKHVETDKLVTTLHSLVMSQQNQNGLLCRDLASLHEKNARQEKELSAAKKEFDALQREVVSLKDKNAIVCQDNQLLRNDITQVQGELSQLKTQTGQGQGEITAVQGEVASLKTQQSVLQADQAKLQSSLTHLEKDKTRLQDDLKKATADQAKLVQGELSQLKTQTGQGQGEITAVKNSQVQLQGEVASLKTQQSVLQADQAKLQNSLTSLENEKTRLQDDVKKVKADQGGMQSNFDRTRNKLQDDLKKVSTQVAFHARLAKVVEPKNDEVIVCSDVHANVGSGYNSVTGIFTAPVSGVYCFVASASPNSHEATKKCCANIIMDGNAVANLLAFGLVNCTAHVSLTIKVGQKVWLKSRTDVSHFHAGWLTSFTGFLVQAEL